MPDDLIGKPREYVNKIKEEITGKKITLAVIQVGNDEASSVYVKQKEKM